MKRYIILATCILAGCSSNSTEYPQFNTTYSKNYQQKALEKFGNAEFSGDAKSINGLGLMYEVGFGVPQNINKAKELWKKAGDMGYGSGYCNLARTYLNDIKTYRIAFDYHHKATFTKEKNHCGLTGLGIAYLYGYGVKPNLNTAENYFLTAIQAKSENGDDEYNLGIIAQQKGQNAEATKWFEAAKQKGFDSVDSDEWLINTLGL
ncbi:Sel1 repeat [Actinobacillus indolicus]|nr:Sel1 repeat [Actinobacillus indolicus]VTU07533.1 Sel1 repeat [Actinobacillus indolicus]